MNRRSSRETAESDFVNSTLGDAREIVPKAPLKYSLSRITRTKTNDEHLVSKQDFEDSVMASELQLTEEEIEALFKK